MHKMLIAAFSALWLALPIAAQAQDAPSYATSQAPLDENIHGRVTNFDGGYQLRVRDERGYLDNVQLHPGTIINPLGLTLAPGMVVSVLGYNAGNYFSANEIDTPYQFAGEIPYYGGHPWNYYGPSISLGFFFGNSGWWHGDRFAGAYRYDGGGGRIYGRAHVDEIYRANGGEYHGRDVVAPREHGGYYGRGQHDEHEAHGHADGGHDRHAGNGDHRR